MKKTLLAAALLAALPFSLHAQIQPSEESLSGLYPGKTYSPYAMRAFPDKVYWGDTHLHTALSADAGLFGNTLGLEEAYRFSRGEEVVSATGLPVRLGRALDWLVIADHSDAMGFSEDIRNGTPNLLANEMSRGWYEGLQQGGDAASAAALDLITNFAQGTIPAEVLEEYMPGAKTYDSVWQRVVQAAETFNEPGKFTTIIGYEWTSLVKGNNLHRNVLFRDGADRAGQIPPMVTQQPVGSTDPLDLYKWMENYEAKTGGSLLALAHNGNLSNGLMFPEDRQYTGKKIDKNYVQKRAKWEPLYEITQIKGDGETHPLLSSQDEFADYETWDAGNLDLTEAKTEDMLQYEYARAALKLGLQLEKKFGTNPYKFGFVGSTDSHTSLPAVEEENFFGKAANAEPSPHAFTTPLPRPTRVSLKAMSCRPPVSPRSGRTKIPGRPFSTHWQEGKPMAPPVLASWCGFLAAGISRKTT